MTLLLVLGIVLLSITGLLGLIIVSASIYELYQELCQRRFK